MTETVTVTNTVLTVNVQLTWGTYLEADNKQLLGTCRYIVDLPSLQKARSENKVQLKETGKRTRCPWILPRQNNQPSNRHKIWRRDHSFEEFMHRRMDIRPLFL